MSPEEVVLIESNKIAIKKILKDLQADGTISDYNMTMILESVLCDYRSAAAYEYITAQVATNQVSEQPSDSNT